MAKRRSRNQADDLASRAGTNRWPDQAGREVETRQDDAGSTMSGSRPETAGDRHASRWMGSDPSEEEIRLRAYHRYLERGGGHGLDFEDWLEAEKELKGNR